MSVRLSGYSERRMSYAQQNRDLDGFGQFAGPLYHSCTSLGVGDGMNNRISPALMSALCSFSFCPSPAEGPSMASLSVTSWAFVCSISASCASKARRRTTARYSINCRLTLSSPKRSASSCDFAFERKSDRVRASEPVGGGTHGNVVSHSS